MPEFAIDYKLNVYGDRNKVRMSVVNELSKEEPGKGKDELASRYTYYVETLSDGNKIFLRRADFRHNGFDFVICVENFNFSTKGRKRNYPKHEDIIEDLKSKKAEDESKYMKLISVLEDVYNCKDICQGDMMIDFMSGYSSELIIKTLKWLFIEQDIRYWNYSGRDMLWNGIKHI